MRGYGIVPLTPTHKSEMGGGGGGHVLKLFVINYILGYVGCILPSRPVPLFPPDDVKKRFSTSSVSQTISKAPLTHSSRGM